jgi:hypothetical protein
MAFGFDDFAGLFDPISDVLGTSGRKGVGLLQQEPEDLQRAAMLAALAASGYGILAAAPGAAGAGASAALVTPEVAALTPEVLATAAPEVIGADVATNAGIDSLYANSADIANQYAMPSNFIGEGQQVAGIGDDILGVLERNNIGVKGVDLSQAGAEFSGAPYGYEPGNAFFERGGVRLEPTASFDTQLMDASRDIEFMRPGQIGSMDTGIGDASNRIDLSRIANIGSQDTQLGDAANNIDLSRIANIGNQDVAINQANDAIFNAPIEREGLSQDAQMSRFRFDNELAARSAAAPPSTIQHFENPASTTQSVFRGNPAESGFQPPQVTKGGYFNNGINGEYTDTLTPFERGMDTAGRYFDSASKWAKDNPYPAAGLAYYGAYKTGMLDQKPVEAPADNYKNPYTMTGFRRSSPSPSAYRYTPRYAEGGIASVHDYAKGKRVSSNAATDFTEFYDQMNARPSAEPLKHGDPGIYYDMDPDTRYLDPMEAAMVRMSKLNSRTNVQAPTMAPSRRMGELDFKPVAAAQGGIMGYAGGGDVPIEDDEFNRLTGRGGGRKVAAEPDAKFSPTSEGAAAVSQFGQRMKSYPGWAPLGLGARVLGAIASSYGDHMARNVNPNYSNEGRQQMQAAQSAAQDAGIASFDAARSGTDRNSVTPGGGSSDARPAPAADRGYGREGQHAAQGGIMGYNLGGYASGGNPRLLRGPGDGMSDHIPATINNRQPARLADGEYVITAEVVSHLGNGSTEAGARQLDAMMKRIRKGRTGTPKQGKQINPRKYLPA